MSDFDVPVVRIGAIQKHPNADTLSLTEVEGYPVIIRTQDFKEGDLAIYLPVEAMIPEGKEWVKTFCSHLKFKRGFHRLKAVRLRGVFSMGMVVPIGALSEVHVGPSYEPRHSWRVGSDVASLLDVVKYEEPEDLAPVPHVPAPLTRWGKVVLFFLRLFGIKNKRRKSITKPMPTYGVGQYRKYKGALQLGEPVIVTEKIHGTNFAAGWHKGKFWVSSHRVLRPVEDNSVYWMAVRKYDLEQKLKKFPNHIFYGEIYGPGIQDMGYDVPAGDFQLRFFDVYDTTTNRFIGYDAFKAATSLVDVPVVPVLYDGPFDPQVVDGLKDGKSAIASHFREGVVIKPLFERLDHNCGRCILKLVGETYLLRKDPTERH